ncbi:hypothetical protein HYG81_11240 [Natrinema zhouii]|uniref:Uncharacterized protein n=1 Tax=Natrinema zhouii TaxID=1710539 RepID=A0A7D6CMT6_9EURY|nr:hypothetical protein [Natrinema zhouii]QLK24694.1 hypothetical protein HYG81_11240 [Natrinema zhouii]
MSRPRSRRALLASAVTTAAVSTGGFEHVSNATNRPAFESGTIPADYYDCHSVTRPDPDVLTDDDALVTLPYPTPPSWTEKDDSSDHASSPVLVDSAAAYATEFERAYRRNEFIARFGNETRTLSLRRTEHRTAAVGSATNADAVMVAIRYNLATGTRHSAADPRDEWDIRVTYYIDENVVLRARYDGVAEELALEPDPRWEGDLVACFGRE